eukprot:GHVN01074769.1.p1 GENE.GHVN01074769.1~~GHVN01074769.1.p1  ORF type:complete len:284 (+),score=13.98 GHVN01074769.1:308-1159(+)
MRMPDLDFLARVVWFDACTVERFRQNVLEPPCSEMDLAFLDDAVIHWQVEHKSIVGFLVVWPALWFNRDSWRLASLDKLELCQRRLENIMPRKEIRGLLCEALIIVDFAECLVENDVEVDDCSRATCKNSRERLERRLDRKPDSVARLLSMDQKLLLDACLDVCFVKLEKVLLAGPKLLSEFEGTSFAMKTVPHCSSWSRGRHSAPSLLLSVSELCLLKSLFWIRKTDETRDLVVQCPSRLPPCFFSFTVSAYLVQTLGSLFVRCWTILDFHDRMVLRKQEGE